MSERCGKEFETLCNRRKGHKGSCYWKHIPYFYSLSVDEDPPPQCKYCNEFYPKHLPGCLATGRNDLRSWLEESRDLEKRKASEHVSSQWIYSNHMHAAKAYQNMIEMLDAIMKSTPPTCFNCEAVHGLRAVHLCPDCFEELNNVK